MRQWPGISMLFVCAAISTALVSLLPPVARADEAQPEAPAAAVVRDGLTEATAAASCWEIKQNDPDAADGAYWLLTPQMDAPERFFCDQTMDGGGWVLIGRGRESWEHYPHGQGSPEALLTRDRTPESFATVQLSTDQVDGLLAGTSVSDLPDGLRVVRAKNDAGTAWQVFDTRVSKMTTWTWALGAEYPVAGYRIDGGAWRTTSATMAGGYGSDSAWNRMETAMTSGRGYRMGFAYGTGASGGSTAASSFLWTSNGRGALPYAELYIRPTATSDDPGFSAIDDAGTGAVTGTPVVSSYASATSWGVTGNLNGRVAEGNAPVQAFAQIGNTMYVGGNFTEVRQGASGTPVANTALAAFDATTGEHIAQFAATFDNQVKDLLVLPDGRLLVGGDFRTVNGESHVGTVVLDPVTGQTDPSWDLRVDNRLSSGVTSVKSLSISGDWVYLGGSFTHLTGQGVSDVYARAGARVSLTGMPDRGWNPEFNGTVVDTDTSADGTRVYAAGYFTKSVQSTAMKATVLSTEPGAPLYAPWVFQGSASERSNYQQTIIDTGSLFFVGGSEHSLMGFNRDSLERVSGSITKNIGGDFQASATDGDVVYAGCHCSVFTYQDAYTWSTLNSSWTRADRIQWVGAWDARTGQQIGEFAPFGLRSSNGGAWSLFVADDGALWVGGDFIGSRTSPTKYQWNGGWVRYPTSDTAAPQAPADLRTAVSEPESVTLAWSAVDEDVTYEVLRDDRVVATTASATAQVPRGGENRFFVRAVDAAGNRSASTPVHLPPAPGEIDPSSPVLIETGASWAYSYGGAVPDAGWSAPGFDDSAWPTGASPIGYGSDLVTTALEPAAAPRPVTAWFRHSFTVADPGLSPSVELQYVADDGAVVYVNGVEVSRTRMADGPVTAETRAQAAVTTQAAQAEPTSVTIPTSMLVAGENVVAVETHLNYRSSPSLSFSASLTRSETIVEPEPEPGPDPDGPEEVVTAGSAWAYRYDLAEPDEAWSSTADVGQWSVAPAPIGWGSATIATPLEVAVADRARTIYFVKDVDLGEIEEDSVLTISVPADDGVVVHINGAEIGRMRMGEGAVTHTTYASAAVSTNAALAEPLVIEVPASMLLDGTNRIAVETHVNYRSTPSVSFDLTALLER